MKTSICDTITDFRLAVAGMRKYMCKIIYQMPAYEAPGIGTMCVDCYGRMYYDPKFVANLHPNKGGYSLIHEAGHLLLKHHEILRPLLGDNPSEEMRKLANIAADVALEQVLLRGGLEKYRPVDVHTYENNGLPPGLTAVEYFHILVDRAKAPQPQPQRNPPPPPPQDESEDDDEFPFEPDVQPGDDDSGDTSQDDSGDGGYSDVYDDDQEGDESSDDGGMPGDDDSDASGDGDPSDGEPGDAEGQGDAGQWPPPDAVPGTGEGGSCADGVPREFELPPDEGWGTHKEEQVLASMQEAVEEYIKQHGVGSVPGEIRMRCKPKVRQQPSPWDLLRSAVQAAVGASNATPQYTYRKLARRQQPDLPRLKGRIATTPSAVVILDTSGSMCSGEDQARALTVIAQGLRRLSSFQVIAGDMVVRDDRRISKLDQIEWVGGGGTDMGRLVQEVDKRQKPQCIIVVTDGETPWPKTKPSAKVIIALTQPKQKHYPIPAWARAIEVNKKGGA